MDEDIFDLMAYERNMEKKTKTLKKILDEGFIETDEKWGIHEVYEKGFEIILYNPFSETIVVRYDLRKGFKKKSNRK